MARTATVQNVRDRWAALCGLDKDNLIADDAANFLEFLNINTRLSWPRAEWPFSIQVFPKVLDSNLFIDLSSDTDISEVLRTYSDDPYLTRNSKLLRTVSVENSLREGVYVPNGVAGTAKTLTGVISTGTTATATLASHGYVTNNYVEITGANESAYNGIFGITVVDADTFTYTMASDPVDTATGTIISTQCTAFLYSKLRESVYTSVSDTLPFKMQDYLARACLADYLNAEGQTDKAIAEKNIAEVILIDEIDRLERQQDQQPVTRINVRQVGVK